MYFSFPNYFYLISRCDWWENHSLPFWRAGEQARLIFHFFMPVLISQYGRISVALKYISSQFLLPIPSGINNAMLKPCFWQKFSQLMVECFRFRSSSVPLSLSLYSLLPRLLAFRLTLAKCSPQGPVRVGQVFVSEAIESKFHYYRQHHPI